MNNSKELIKQHTQEVIFASLFLLSNKLQVAGDQYLSESGMTTKQWFLTAVIMQFGDNAPTLTEVAEFMGSSRQNVKQLALKLEKNDFLKLERDEHDTRAIRLKITDKSRSFWDKRQSQDQQFIREVFKYLSNEETEEVANSIKKILRGIEEVTI
jgi:MarR family transcriptional regulator for hemolysin